MAHCRAGCVDETVEERRSTGYWAPKAYLAVAAAVEGRHYMADLRLGPGDNGWKSEVGETDPQRS